MSSDPEWKQKYLSWARETKSLRHIGCHTLIQENSCVLNTPAGITLLKTTSEEHSPHLGFLGLPYGSPKRKGDIEDKFTIKFINHVENDP